MGGKGKRHKQEVQKVDAESIKKAVVSYILSSHKTGLLFIKEDLVQSKPEIDEKGMIRIGEWVFDSKDKILRKYLPPDRPFGYDYVIKLARDADTWKVIGINRVEVFKKPG
mgnify:FL=1